jgi:hypothetical protein
MGILNPSFCIRQWEAVATATPKPSPNQPGTLGQQLLACELYAADPCEDRVAAWERARSLVIPHAREWYVNRRAFDKDND